MSDKPDLFSITTKPLTDIAPESADDFKKWVLEDGLKPSVALHKMIDKYNCTKLDSSYIFKVIRLTYPGIVTNTYGFDFGVIDSGYPYCSKDIYSDDDFDAALDELVNHPPEY